MKPILVFLFLFVAMFCQAEDPVGDALKAMYGGELDKASKLIDAVLAENPKSGEALLAKGRILLLEKKYDEAADTLFKAIGVDPKLTDAYFYIGEAAFQERSWPDALEAYSRFLPHAKDGRDAYLKVIYAKIAMHEFSEAGKLMNRFDPNDLAHPGYYFSHAALAVALKKDAEADTYLRRAKTLYGIPMINRYQPDYFFILNVLNPASPAKAGEKAGDDAIIEDGKAAVPAKAPAAKPGS